MISPSTISTLNITKINPTVRQPQLPYNTPTILYTFYIRSNIDNGLAFSQSLYVFIIFILIILLNSKVEVQRLSFYASSCDGEEIFLCSFGRVVFKVIYGFFTRVAINDSLLDTRERFHFD